MITVTAEMAAFDALPQELRAHVRRCRCVISAIALQGYLDQGYQVHTLIEQVLAVDQRMVATHHQQLASGQFARLQPR